jgi:GAF domain-containing protein
MTYSSTDPVTSLQRLTEISTFDLYSATVRDRLDELARLGAEHFELPIAIVSIVLDTTQYHAGRYGLRGWLAEVDGAPIEWSFCVNTVRNGAPYIVEDALSDELQQDNPIVTEDGLRCYAGAPLLTSTGEVLGAYCVAGAQPRRFSPADLEDLRRRAAEVVAEIEAHRLGPGGPAVT